MSNSEQDEIPRKRKPLTVSLLPDDELRLSAIRADIGGRANMTDVVREALKTEATKRNLGV